MFRQTCVMWVASKRTKHMCLNQHWGSMHNPLFYCWHIVAERCAGGWPYCAHVGGILSYSVATANELIFSYLDTGSKLPYSSLLVMKSS